MSARMRKVGYIFNHIPVFKHFVLILCKIEYLKYPKEEYNDKIDKYLTIIFYSIKTITAQNS